MFLGVRERVNWEKMGEEYVHPDPNLKFPKIDAYSVHGIPY